MVGRQPYAPATFTPGDIPGTHFQRLSRPQGTWFCLGSHGKKSPVTPPGIDPGTVRLVAQCLNHYATPGPPTLMYRMPLITTMSKESFWCPRFLRGLSSQTSTLSGSSYTFYSGTLWLISRSNTVYSENFILSPFRISSCLLVSHF